MIHSGSARDELPKNRLKICSLERGLLILFIFFGIISSFNTVYAAEEQLDFSPLEGIWIEHGGRVKPFYTFSVETLQSIYGKSVYKPEDGRAPMSSMEFILSFWLSEPTAEKISSWENEPMILVQNLELKRKLGLDIKRKHFSFAELSKNHFLNPENNEANLDWPEPLKLSLQQVRERMFTLWTLIHNQNAVSSTLSPFHVIPRLPGDGHWLTLGNKDRLSESGRFTLGLLDQLKKAYQEKNKTAFDLAARKFADYLHGFSPAANPPGELRIIEVAYMKYHPFRLAWMSYLVAGILFAFSSLGALWQRRWGYRLGWVFILAGFLLQCIGLACRIYISGRPPVTNMYETVIWVAFGAVFFSILLGMIYKSRTVLLAACSVAVISLILADSQPAILDASIRPLVPVLRSNFWLTIHVLTITLSYAAFTLALALGHMILIRHVFGSVGKREKDISIEQTHYYLYRTLQIGVFLLATGTILGAVWANYSWGRFWDWDPKETWALIALLSYLIVLHGRLLGWWQGLGLAVGSILCFLSVLMAWYGVNFILGQGLHSYGFGTGGQSWVYLFVGFELLFVVASLLWIRLKNNPTPVS